MTTSPDHLFWSASREAWVPVGSMRPGELLRSVEGAVATVEAISPPRYGFIELYNLEVEELHTFFVGASGTGSALVHNGRGNYIKKPANRMPKADRFPTRDPSGRIHGDIPSHVPRDWRSGEIQDAIGEVQGSLAARRGNQAIFGPDRGHDVRVVQEEQWLRQLQQRLDDIN